MIELSGCIIEKNGKILLLHRKSKNHWEIPGGKIEKGETHEEAAIREAKEEIGCDIKLEEYLGFTDFKIQKQDFRSHQFKARIISGAPTINEDLFDKIEYIDLKKTKEKLAPNIRK